MVTSANATNDNKPNIFGLLRILQGKRVKDLALELSVTPAYINAIENGDRFPSNRLLKDYAQALGVSVNTLLAFKPSSTSNKKMERILQTLLQMICDAGNTLPPEE